jgi:hypothetical protein
MLLEEGMKHFDLQSAPDFLRVNLNDVGSWGSVECNRRAVLISMKRNTTEGRFLRECSARTLQ